MGHLYVSTDNIHMVHINVRDEIVHERHEQPRSPPPGYDRYGNKKRRHRRHRHHIHVDGDASMSPAALIGVLVLVVVIVAAFVIIAVCGGLRGSGDSDVHVSYDSGLSHRRRRSRSRNRYGTKRLGSTVNSETDIDIGPTYGDTQTKVTQKGRKRVTGQRKVFKNGEWVRQTDTAQRKHTTTVTTRRLLESPELYPAES